MSREFLPVCNDMIGSLVLSSQRSWIPDKKPATRLGKARLRVIHASISFMIFPPKSVSFSLRPLLRNQRRF